MKKRILNIIGTLERGGVETWLKRVAYKIDKNKYQFDFCCLGEKEGVYANDLKQLGCNIYVLNLKSGLLNFSLDYIFLLKKEKYNIVHCHVHYFSGYIAFLTRLAGVKHFISHSHNTSDGKRDNIFRSIYRSLMRFFIVFLSKFLLAASTEAGRHLFGDGSVDMKKFSIIRCGLNIEIKKNHTLVERVFPDYSKLKDKIFLVNVARFDAQKNQIFLIDVIRVILEKDKNFCLLLIGDGPLRYQIEKKVSEYKIEESVKFLGNIDNANELLPFFDVFVMPSLYEGLPVAALEAQAAGLPVLLSCEISKETAVVEDLVTFIPLEVGPKGWADQIIKVAYKKPQVNVDNIKIEFENKGFSLDASINKLNDIYKMCK